MCEHWLNDRFSKQINMDLNIFDNNQEQERKQEIFLGIRALGSTTKTRKRNPFQGKFPSFFSWKLLKIAV